MTEAESKARPKNAIVILLDSLSRCLVTLFPLTLTVEP